VTIGIEKKIKPGERPSHEIISSERIIAEIQKGGTKSEDRITKKQQEGTTKKTTKKKHIQKGKGEEKSP